MAPVFHLAIVDDQLASLTVAALAVPPPVGAVWQSLLLAGAFLPSCVGGVCGCYQRFLEQRWFSRGPFTTDSDSVLVAGYAADQQLLPEFGSSVFSVVSATADSLLELDDDVRAAMALEAYIEHEEPEDDVLAALAAIFHG